jgi:hypothetical protein
MSEQQQSPADRLEADVGAVLARHGYGTAGANGTVREVAGVARQYAADVQAAALENLAASVAELVVIARQLAGDEPARRARRST